MFQSNYLIVGGPYYIGLSQAVIITIVVTAAYYLCVLWSDIMSQLYPNLRCDIRFWITGKVGWWTVPQTSLYRCVILVARYPAMDMSTMDMRVDLVMRPRMTASVACVHVLQATQKVDDLKALEREPFVFEEPDMSVM
jgi:hypothetical protein